jgi:two-component system OmpR family sensor kinase
MSLRLRLTLLYGSLLGGVLLIFGALVYWLLSILLINQIDKTLAQEADQLVERFKVNAVNEIDPRSVSNFMSAENLIFQVWGSNSTLQMARPAVWQTPLDDFGRRAGKPYFNSTSSNKTHIRVFSMPLKTERGPVGVLQVAQNLALVDVAQRTLASVLVMLALMSMVLAGLAAWIATGRALSALATVTRVATQITRADDLQRRIPLTGPAEDEVGQLIQAFNQTLERLEKLFNAQRRFLADVSHELRTPLTVIKGNVGLMSQSGAADEESLESINTEVDRLSRLVGDLLLLAQADSGKVRLDLHPVELDTILLEVYNQMKLLVGGRIEIHLSEIDQIPISGDRDRLKQVFLNIIGNAVDFTPSGGQVSLSLRRVGEQAQIMVSDTGPGIPAEDLEHIFERFYRGEKSRKRAKGTGFGLGLSIAYWIIRNHQGNIEVHSQEGKGTTFCIWLPTRQTE